MLAPYRALFGLPGVPRLVAGSIVGRIPYGMVNLGILLLVREATGSFAAAGLVSGANFAAACVAAPVQGRVIDRVGQPRVLVICALLDAASLVALVALGDAPVWALAACAAAAGAFVPPLSPSLRTLWPGLVQRGGADPSVLQTAYAFEAVAIEVLFILG